MRAQLESVPASEREKKEMTRSAVSRLIVMVALMAIWTLGCATTKEYADFATTGVAYTKTLDAFLEKSDTTAIANSSEYLLVLRKRTLAEGQKQLPTELTQQLKDSLTTWNELNKKRHSQFQKLREQLGVMTLYFTRLNDLATSKAPEQIQQSMGGIVTKLNGLGVNLMGEPGFQDIFNKVTTLAVNSVIRSMLRQELEAHQRDILTALTIQERMLERFGKELQENLEAIRKNRADRLASQYTASAPITDPDGWVANRAALITWPDSVAELQKAGGSAKKVREAFESLLKGELTWDKINDILVELDSLLKATATYVKARG